MAGDDDTPSPRSIACFVGGRPTDEGEGWAGNPTVLKGELETSELVFMCL
jgi:hypothetical protein